MIAIVLAVILGASGQMAPLRPSATPIAAAESHSALHDALMQKLGAMNAADHGVFHDDVTSVVAPYFPVGQSFADTERVLAEQKLGPLRHFHGNGDGSGWVVYVSHADLMSAAYSDVSVVIDFDFERKTEHDMTLKKVRAFLQASSM